MTTPTQDGWIRCPKGEWQQLASHLRARRQHLFVLGGLTKLLAVAAVLCGLQLAVGAAARIARDEASSAGLYNVVPAEPCHSESVTP